MGINKREIHEHPSYGMLRIGRVSGHSGHLFGSNAEPNNYISMELHRGHMEREMSNDWYHPDEMLFRVKMSPVQFAELLTTQNGSGVPVTIERMNGKPVEQLEHVEDKRQATARQFRERMDEFLKRIKERKEKADAVIGKKTLSKNDQEQLRNLISSVVQEVELNMPFFVTCFDEEMEKVVLDAKAEIHAAVTHTIVQAGIKALGIEFNSDAPMLESK